MIIILKMWNIIWFGLFYIYALYHEIKAKDIKGLLIMFIMLTPIIIYLILS